MTQRRLQTVVNTAVVSEQDGVLYVGSAAPDQLARHSPDDGGVFVLSDGVAAFRT